MGLLYRDQALHLYFFGTAGILFGLAVAIRAIWVFFILWPISMFIPFVFQNKFRRRFSKNAVLKFDNEQVIVDLGDLRTGYILSHNEFKYEDIKYIKAANSAKDDSSSVKLIFKDGSKKNYTFTGQGEGKGDTDVVGTFAKYVNAYNGTKPENEQIAPLPILLGSKTGKLLIILLTVVVFVGILFEILFAPSAIPKTILGAIPLYILVLAQRARDLREYRNIKNN